MRIRLLGTLDVSDNGLPVGLGGPRQKRVAACLIAAAPDSLTVDRLIDEVWGDRAPTTAAHVISTYVSNLRKVLGERIISRDGRHGIDLSEDDVDAIRFAELLEMGRGKVDLKQLNRMQEMMMRMTPEGKKFARLNVVVTP